MANKQVYTLDINTSGLISGYKNAIKLMELAGASADVTKGLTSSLKKLEEQYERLSNEGKAGFTNSREIENFKKRVDRLMGSFRGFESSLEKVGGDIGKLAVKSKDAGVKIEKAFNKLGFKNVDASMKNILQSEDKIKATSTVIEKELSERVKIVDKLSEKYQKAANAAQAASDAAAARTTRAKENGANSLGKSYVNAAGNNAPVFNRTNASESRKTEILNQAAEFIKASLDIEQAWGLMELYIKTHGLEKYFSGANGANGMAGLRQNMENVFKETSRVATEEGIKVQEALERQAAAQREVNEATERAREIGKQGKDGTWSADASKTREITNAVRERINAEERLHQSLTVDVNDEEAVSNALNDVNNASAGVAGNANQVDSSLDNMIGTLSDTARGAENAAKTFDNMRNRILSLLSATSVLNLLKRTIKKTYEDVKQLDKSFASIAMVTKYSVSEMWGRYGDYAEMAARLGQQTNSVIQASALFYQQGLETNEALELTTNTMKLATLAGNDFETATQEMTSAIRGFKMEMAEGGRVTDVYSNLAAHAAATVDDIAQAMARTASIANSAGMSFENTSAFLTQMIETTQESAENIGTSLKTIIARFTELKENVAGTADSEFDDLDFNKVDKALKTVGVDLKDVNGQFRNLDEVFLELSEKWATLDRNTQRYVATIAAGSRQQSRFIAMMDNYDRTVQLMEEAANAEGRADEQFAKYADTMEYKLNQLKTKWEEFRVNALNSDFFKSAIGGLSNFLNRLKNVDFKKALLVAPAAIWAAKTFINTFLINFRKNVGQFRTLGREIGNALTKSKPKVNVELEQLVLKRQLSDLESKLYAITNKPHLLKMGIENPSAKDMVAQYKAEVESATGAEISWADAVNKLASELGIETGSLNENYEAIKKKLQEMQKTNAEYKQALAQQAQFNAQQLKSVAISQLTSAAISSATIALSGFISGTMSGSEALKSFATQMFIMGTLMVLSAALSSVTTAIKVANAKAEEGAWLGVFAAEVAATMGAALLVAAVTGALVVVALLCAALIKQSEEAKKAASATEQLGNATKELEEAKTKRTTDKNELKELQEEKKTLTDIKKEYTELSKKRIKTTEDLERLNELYDEIKDKYPEIIQSENEQLHLLTLYNDELDKKLTALDKEIAKKKELVALDNAAVLRAQTAVSDYTGIRDIEKATGISTDVSSEMTDFKEMTSGRLKRTRSDVKIEYADEYGNATYNQFGNEIIAFTKKLTDGAVDFETAGKDVQEDIIDAWNYVMAGEGDVADGFKEAADEMRMAVEEASKAFNHFAEYLDVTKEGAKELYGDKSETEQTIRAIFKADEMDSQKEWSELKKRKAAKNSGTAGEHFDWMVELLGLAGNQEAEDLADAFEEIMHGVADGAWGRENDMSDAVKGFNATAQAQFEKWGIETDAQYDEFFGKDNVADEDTFRLLEKKFYEELTAMQLAQKTGYEDASEELISQVTKMQTEMGKQTIEEGMHMWDTLNELLNEANIDESAKQEVRDLSGEYSETKLNQISEKLRNAYGVAAEGIKIDTADMLVEAYDKAVEQVGTEGLALKLVSAQLKILQDNKIKEEDWAAFMQIDWSAITDPATFKTFRESQITLMKEQGVANAEAMFDEMAKAAEDYGALEIDIDTEVELDKFIEQVDELKDKIEELGDAIVDSVKDMTDSGEVSFKTFQTAMKSLGELGLNAYDYYDIDAAGKITINQEKLNKLYQDQLKAGEELLIQERNKAMLKKAEIDLQIKLIEALIKSLEEGNNIVNMEIDMNNNLQPVLLTWVKIAQVISEILGKTFDESQFQTKIYANIDNKQRQEVIDVLKEQLEPLKSSSEILGDTIETMNQEIADRDKYNAAALRDFNQRLLEAEGKNADVTKATQEHEKALEDLAKAQKDVTDKQEKLNEALDAYNKLLYGDDNRKSTLDFLYNYEEAIKSFNDEISRSKDLLDNSKSIAESADALQRYGAATHNLIAEETAKQLVLEAGLKNYAEMIERGSYAYTNSETGEQTNINFGDYARKDNRTGKYMIDQRLLNEARFTDLIKDLLEELVSNYNKYSEEYLKSQDEVRKAEQELEKERRNALEKYNSMLTEIADALKAQYQAEVDALKGKYDAMKDADDDYLDALQDAIDKQRKLREQENAYEDLAKQEKKLSLMQRDTSGANELETRKLEEEILDTREDLLDLAIDNVIDGLSKLYESQQELRDSEVELKEALLDNTLYWNQLAESLAGSFDSAEEYAQFLSSLSEEYAMMTLTQQQAKLQEYGDTYTAATEYMALQAMDVSSETGDYIIDTMTVTSEEVSTIVAETAETFTTEVVRSYNETTDAFQEDMKKAEDSIREARDALAEAIQKLNECGAAANAAAQAVAEAYAAAASGGTGLDTAPPEVSAPAPTWEGATSLYNLVNAMGVDHNALDDISHKLDGDNEEIAMIRLMMYKHPSFEQFKKALDLSGVSSTNLAIGLGINGMALTEMSKNTDEEGYLQRIYSSLKTKYRFAEGGLVNFTGPAFVDGTPEKPEAFLSPEDTARIGEAAKILSDIPWMDRDTDNTSVVTNNGGDVSVEINLNIDHISSDTDIDDMIQRIKDEIVDVARPEGTNVILQQQLN